MTGRGSLDYSRNVLLLWRSNNMLEESCVPIVTALNKVGRKDLADFITITFSTSQVAGSPSISMLVSNGQLRLWACNFIVDMKCFRKSISIYKSGLKRAWQVDIDCGNFVVCDSKAINKI